jgi:hypothetical protein
MTYPKIALGHQEIASSGTSARRYPSIGVAHAVYIKISASGLLHISASQKKCSGRKQQSEAQDLMTNSDSFCCPLDANGGDGPQVFLPKRIRTVTIVKWQSE